MIAETQIAMQLERNNPAFDAEYLGGLNACFPQWGDQSTLDWVFHRKSSMSPMADRLLLRAPGPLAGSAVTYRTLVMGNGCTVRAGIMTGSWTLPAARGQGCFARMIEESIEATRRREGALLLAFVTHDNPSRRQLEKAGASLVPTSYLITQPQNQTEMDTEGAIAIRELPHSAMTEVDLHHWQRERTGTCHFAYTSSRDWRQQFLTRPWPTRVLVDGGGSFAILESHQGLERINAFYADGEGRQRRFLRALQLRAAQHGKGLFAYAANDQDLSLYRAAGFTHKQGFLCILAVDWSALHLALSIPDSERGQSSADLTDPAGPWYLGSWKLQSGDRM